MTTVDLAQLPLKSSSAKHLTLEDSFILLKTKIHRGNANMYTEASEYIWSF